jgi:hypothetical protein
MKKLVKKLVQGVVTSSPDYYCPKNVPVNIWLDKDGLPVTVHRLDNGAGTYLRKHEAKRTIFEII